MANFILATTTGKNRSLRVHTQIGVDDCSTDLGLRGQPVLRGLIGPMPEGKNIIRYESPEVFEALTKEWGQSKSCATEPDATASECRVELSSPSWNVR